MKKLKNALILLLAAALIALGGALPRISATMMDRDTVNQSGSRDMTPIALEVNGETRSLPPSGKIDLLRSGQTIAIAQEDAAASEEAINKALDEAMEGYVDAGIFDWFSYSSRIAEPRLCIDPDTPDQYAIFWTVTIINKKAPYQTLTVDIDDERGKIYSIRYDIYGAYSMDGVWERNYALVDALIHVYLTQLGLLDVQQNVEPNTVYAELDGEVLCGGLYLENEAHDLQRIEFYVTGTGSFWIYFPS